MDETSFHNNLNELLIDMGSLPEDERLRLEAINRENLRRHNKLKSSIRNLQDSMDYLRLSVKYVLFDLEATRRENAHLRKFLEDEPEA